MVDPLRIALITDCYLPRLGGIELQVRDLAAELARLGHRVEVVTPTPGVEVADGVDEVDGVRVHRLAPSLPTGDIAVDRAWFVRLGRLLDERAFDVVHVHSGVLSPAAYGAVRVAAERRMATVVTSHCIWGYATPLAAAYERRHRWSAWPVVFSAVSDVAAADIRSATKGRADVRVLPNGIHTDEWQVPPVDGDPDVVTICSTMRLAPRKRPRHLVPMLAAVRDRMPAGVRLRAVIIGDGTQRALVERLVARHGLHDVVELPGTLPRDEIKRRLAAADIYVAPANLESFGIAALEARCVGLPVVAKACTGIREFVSHGREGLLAHSDDEMVLNLTELVRSPALRAEIAEHNRTTRPDCDWADVVSANVAAYGDAAVVAAGTASGSPRGAVRHRASR